MPLPWSAYAVARAAGLLGVAAFAGSAVTNAVASRLLVSDTALAAAATLEVDRSSPKRDDEPDAKALAREQQLALALDARAEVEAEAGVDLIVSHNIFCPACQPIPAADATAEQKPAMSATELPLALMATMESDDPLSSMATILDTEHASTRVFGVGDPVRPGVFVAGIRRGVVVLRSTEGMQTLGFEAPEQPKSKKAKAKPKKPKKGSREIPGAREAIECKGNACIIDRKFVEQLMKNPRLLTKQAKLVPAVKDGETRGFRVHRVRTGTLPKLLGLKNGDTLLAVNGTELDSMDQALSLYTKLRRASELSLTVERKGKVFEKQISIR
jgi:general secretion pathway protein C